MKENVKAIFALPKWAKVFLAVLSVVAVAGLITAFSLKSWAADKVESGQLVLKGIAKGWQGRLLQDENYTADEIKAFLESLDPQKATQENADENLAKKQIVPSKFAFDGRLYFARLDFLLRSKVIAYIDIQGISWGENIDKNAISEITSQNRHIKFITSQDLQGLNAQNIGKVEYKMDFNPLIYTILKYYFIIVLAVFVACVLSKIKCEKPRFNYLAYALVALGVVVRIYQYIFHKDLWLDEASVAYSMYGAKWSELFFAPLPNGQSMPLLFLVLSKFLGGIFGYGEHTLYFLPCVFGILTLFLALKIAELLFGKNSFGLLCFITLVCGSLGLLYYSAEFKQYGIEAFCGFLLVYFYLKNLAFKKFIALSVLCFLSSHTGIFVAFACVFGYFYKTLSSPFSLKAWIKANKPFIALSVALGVLFIAYYFGYVRFQATKGFYDYWKEYFVPLNPLELPSFLVRISSVFDGFTPFEKNGASLMYMLVSCVGLYALWRNRRDMFFVCVGMLVIYVGLSLCKIYPWGHGGLIGGRLSLFMSVFFYVLCASGAAWLYEGFKAKSLRTLMLVVLIALAVFGGYKNTLKFLPEHRNIQQTHEFITQIAKEYAESKLNDNEKCVFVYSHTNAAFMYYTHLDNVKIAYKTFDKNFKFEDLGCQKSWILASHYPDIKGWDFLLVAYAKSTSKNVKVEMAKTGWGSVLIRLER